MRSARTLAAIGLVVGPLMAYTGFLLSRRPSLFDGGDQILLELDVWHASRLDRLVGAYSQFGFAHPGPTWFYLMAPLYRLLGSDEVAAVAAGAILQAGFASAVVVLAVCWRGARAALPAAVIVLAYLRAIAIPGIDALWNPFAVTLASVLFLLLAARACAGSRRARWATGAVGGFLVQTDISVSVLVGWVGLLVLARSGLRHWALDVWGRIRTRNTRRTLGSAAAGLTRRRTRDPIITFLGLVILLEWAPPLVQQFTQSPGNLTRMAATLAAGGHLHAPWSALAAQAQAVSVFPFGSLAAGPAASRPGAVPVLALIAWVLGAWTLRRWGKSRHDRLAAEIGSLSLWAVLITFVAACMVRGAMNAYQLYWMSGLPTVALLGWATCTLPRRGRPATPTRPRPSPGVRAGDPSRRDVTSQACIAVVAVLLAGSTAGRLADATVATGSHGTDATSRDVARLVDRYLADGSAGARGRGVLILNRDPRAGSGDIMLNLVLHLTKRGWHPILPPPVALASELPNPADPAAHTILIAESQAAVPHGFTILGPVAAGAGASIIAAR